jgi:hypothetical protein
MPRYLIERTFHADFNIPDSSAPEQDRQLFIENNAVLGAVWIYSLVSPDRKKSYCIYDAPTPESLRQAASRNRLPVDRITEVQLLEIKPHHNQ